MTLECQRWPRAHQTGMKAWRAIKEREAAGLGGVAAEVSQRHCCVPHQQPRMEGSNEAGPASEELTTLEQVMRWLPAGTPWCRRHTDGGAEQFATAARALLPRKLP